MPRTSDACFVCKSRKIRCEMRDGGCLNCARSSIKCPGRSSKTQAYKPRFKSPPDCRPAKACANLQPVKASNLNTRQNNVPPFTLDSKTALVRASPDPGPQNRMAAFSHFLEGYLPDSTVGQGYSYYSYLQHLPERLDRNPALCSAIEAVTVSQMGAELKDEALLRNAGRLYCNALRQMTATIDKAAVNGETIGAAILLGLCEFSPSTSPGGGRGWTSHVAGQLQMLRMVGPEAIKDSPFLFHLFLNVRNAAISLGAIERKPTVFAQPQWKALTATPSLIDAWLYLGDINVEIPGHLRALEQVLTGDGAVDAAAMTARLLAFEARLAHWATLFPPATAAAGPWLVAWTRNTVARALPRLPAFEQLHTFSSFRAGMLHMSWFVSQAALLKARDMLAAASARAVPTGPLSARVGLVECARQITKSAAYCCQARFGSSGRIAALVCLNHASGAFLTHGLSDEANWCGLLVAQIRAAGVCQPPVLVP